MKPLFLALFFVGAWFLGGAIVAQDQPKDSPKPALTEVRRLKLQVLLFAGGSATLSSDREALMLRIAQAISRQSGPVLVTGHTDNTPIRMVRFPSNWHLSEERAQTVQRLLVSGGVAAERVRAEGRADGEPLVANDSPANRSLNRRVEITLMVGRAGASGASGSVAVPVGPRPTPPQGRP